MRRISALLALLAIVGCWAGCASERVNSNTSSNAAPATQAAPAPMPAQNMNSAANTSAPPRAVGGPAPGIKPPMKNENK